MIATANSDSSRIDCLDGFRALAALWVLIVHCMMWGGAWVIPLPHNPKLPVDIFMIISGFLMVERHRGLANGSVSWWRDCLKFWCVRFFRIAPLYYLVLAMVFIFNESFRGGYATLWTATYEAADETSFYNPARMDYSAINFVGHLSFLFGLSPSAAHSTMLPDWSLSLEMQFYAVFPFMMLLAGRIGFATMALVTGLSGLVWLLASRHFPALQFHEPSFLLLRINVFLAGMAAAHLRTEGDEMRASRVLHVLLMLVLLCKESWLIMLFGALLVFCTIHADQIPFRFWRNWRHHICAVLGNTQARFLGNISYGVYLVHGWFISLVGNHLLVWSSTASWSARSRVNLLIGITLFGSLGLGWALYQFVEKPGIKLGRYITKTWSTSLPA